MVSRYQQEVTTYNNYHDKGIDEPEYDKREAHLLLLSNSYSYYCIGSAWQQRESKDLKIGIRMKVLVLKSLSPRMQQLCTKRVAS